MIPPQHQEIIRKAVVYYWTITHLQHFDGTPGSLAPVQAEIDAAKAAIAWLDAQPEQPSVPEPAWDDAPEWANWWAVDEDGRAFWYAAKPRTLISCWTAIRSAIDGKVTLPLGLDWRTTLRRRPG